MKMLYVAVVLLTGSLSFAKVTISAALNTGNVLGCQDASQAYSTYRSNLESVEKIKFMISTTSELVTKVQLRTLLDMAQTGLNNSLSLVRRYDEMQIIAVSVTLDEQKTLPAHRLTSIAGEGRIRFANASVNGTSIAIAPQTTEVTMFGARMCNAIAKANGDVNAAAAALLNPLLGN